MRHCEGKEHIGCLIEKVGLKDVASLQALSKPSDLFLATEPKLSIDCTAGVRHAFLLGDVIGEK